MFASEAIQESDPAAVTAPKIAGSMARVEYRDQNGQNLAVLVAVLNARHRASDLRRGDGRWV
jgi:dolichyl-phosphate-mannose-protein mannosyltransferase